MPVSECCCLSTMLCLMHFHNGGGHKDFRSCGFDHFLDRFSVFAFLQFAGFSFMSIWFPVFGKYTSGFLDLVINVVFSFPVLIMTSITHSNQV